MTNSDWQAPASQLGIEILDFRPVERNTLRGFAKIKVRLWGGLVVDGIAIHTKNERSWAQLPAKPMLDRDGNVVREDDGRIRYVKMLGFDDRDVSDNFSRDVLNALRATRQ
jgi:hypothetical protein